MKTTKFRKILIANRGEIALRIMRSLKKLNIESVAIYSHADADALFVSEADEAWPLGDGTIPETYLNIPKIIEIALKAKADAVHPGYGFLSENPILAEACEANELIFIGPSPTAIALMGNKIAARNAAVENGLPVTLGLIGNVDELLDHAAKIPMPILVKAAAGGGGKGMRIVRDTASLKEILQSTSREAANYFGDGSVYIEQFVEEPRHIEIQVLGDHHGNVVHLFERECSIQRRYQKIIEESPSPSITHELRLEMGQAAVKLCKAIGYFSAGTIEFLVDRNFQYYFLEMNTRIQVEHPVTEMVTGLDLIEAQIKIAQGEPLAFDQRDLCQKGHAIECRIYAEDPEAGFRPSPGFIHLYREPEMNGLRIDSSINNPSEVMSFYDPMISKLIAFGDDRNQAIEKAVDALQHYAIHGIETNIPFLISLLKQQRFIDNKISTTYCDQELETIISSMVNSKFQRNQLLSAGAFLLFELEIYGIKNLQNVWRNIGYWRHHMPLELFVDENSLTIEIVDINERSILIKTLNQQHHFEFLKLHNGKLHFMYDGEPYWCFVSRDHPVNGVIVQLDGILQKWVRKGRLQISAHEESSSNAEDAGNLFAPMPGKVIQINVKEGQQVNRGAVLLVIEAMKMENNMLSPMDAVIEKLNVAVGDMVDTKAQLIHLVAANHN